MFRSTLIDSASTRAHSAILNTLEVEIITRRDTAKSPRDRANLRMFVVARNAFLIAWEKLVPEMDSISYAIAWDQKLAKSLRKSRAISEVESFIEKILDDVAVDIAGMFPITNFEEILGAEEALNEIMSVELDDNLLAFA